MSNRSWPQSRPHPRITWDTTYKGSWHWEGPFIPIPPPSLPLVLPQQRCLPIVVRIFAAARFRGLTERVLASDNNDGNDLPFNYVPSFAAGIVFVVLFSIVTGTPSSFCFPDSYLTYHPIAIHLGQALHARAWFLFPTVITGGFGEIIGWAGRLWGSKNPTSQDPFLMQ